MRVGAIILAAGKSSRMGNFKPLLPLGNQTMIEHIIDTFQKISCENIVVVTGRERAYLEQYVKSHCRGTISFVHNAHYETNEMLDSIKLGLPKVQTERIFITTTDIPLFSYQTLEGMLKLSSDIVKPSFHKKCGHPILLSESLIKDILDYHGEGGLKGALASTHGEAAYFDTEDEGILWDADTKEDYQNLLEIWKKR